MGRLRVGVIGTGNPAQGASRMGFAMAYQHANAYAKFDNCQLVACADIKAESAETFVEMSGTYNIYLSHQAMLAQEDLDLVTICVRPHLPPRW
jgi:predicted dehydrogenase